MHIRQLGIADAAACHALRLRMLRIHPDAFTSSFEEDVEKPLSWVEQRLVPGAAAPDDFVLGAFDAGDQLIGSASRARS